VRIGGGRGRDVHHVRAPVFGGGIAQGYFSISFRSLLTSRAPAL
jgi:hypothetical protein